MWCDVNSHLDTHPSGILENKNFESVGVELGVDALIVQTRLPDVQDSGQDVVVAVEVRSVDTHLRSVSGRRLYSQMCSSMNLKGVCL